MKDPIQKALKTKEEVKLFYKRLDLTMRKIGLGIMKILYKEPGRLNPSGKMGGIMLVGTNPSIHSKLTNIWEDNYGIFLKACLKEAGINHEEIWITNLYKRPTEKNRLLDDEEIDKGLQELLCEISVVNPKVIGMLGKQVQIAMDPDNNGYIQLEEMNLVGLPHPSWIKLYATPEQKVDFINQLKRLKNY